jgi:hypothetical protein
MNGCMKIVNSVHFHEDDDTTVATVQGITKHARGKCRFSRIAITISPPSKSTIAEFTINFTLSAIKASKYIRKYSFIASEKTAYAPCHRFIILPERTSYRFSVKEKFSDSTVQRLGYRLKDWTGARNSSLLHRV